MAGNSFGELFRITTFGESHGTGVGVIIDGCPSGVSLSESDIQPDLDRRRPGQSAITTGRAEKDTIKILSGTFQGKTTGAPIALITYNQEFKSEDYEHLKDVYRPSHADFTYEAKYGVRDYRGSGRASARETQARVAAGAVAKKILKEQLRVEILSYVERVADISAKINLENISLAQIESNIVRCPDKEAAEKMIETISKTKAEGDSLGGVIRCVVKGVPAGLGEPVFDKLHADLGKAMLSINAVKGFEIGSGFEGTKLKGSQHNDSFIINKEGEIGTKSNHSGGVQGGISNGELIHFRVAFKPVATISKAQQTVSKDRKVITLEARGRHDPCVLPRAVPIVDAMAALVLVDHWLRAQASRIS